MATVAGQIEGQNPLLTAKRKRVLIMGSITLTSGGNTIASQSWDNPGVTAAGSAGTYTIAYPASPGSAQFYFTVFDTGGGTPNIEGVKVTAKNPATGALTFVTMAAAAVAAASNTSNGLTIEVLAVLDCNNT